MLHVIFPGIYDFFVEIVIFVLSIIADQEQHAGMTWGDLMEEEEIREPGRAVQMHEKLSSPSRRRYSVNILPVLYMIHLLVTVFSSKF